MAILTIKDAQGNIHEVLAIKGEKGKDAVTDQKYDPASKNAQSGVAVSQALKTLQTADGTVVSQNADFAEVAEWWDGNPDNEDRTGYFVCANVPVDGIVMKKATSIDDVKGVSILAPAFAGNFTKDKVDSNGNLLPKYSYVAIIGFVPVIDNGTCTVGGRCMPDDNGCAIPSSNSMGYQVINRIDENRVLIIIEPNGDMVQRIKTKLNQMQEDIDEIEEQINNGDFDGGNEPNNNIKLNDENNIVGYKGYHMISSELSSDKKSISIELRDANLEEKAIDNYKIDDLVNIEANTHLYQNQKIKAITTNDKGNTVVTLEQIDGGNINFSLEAEDELENWLYVSDKYVGELIPQFSHAVVSGINTVASGYAAFASGRDNKVYGNYGFAVGRKNIAAYLGFATGLQTQSLAIGSESHGRYTIAKGENSIALGQSSEAIGHTSLATGFATKAIGEGSVSMGSGTQAIGNTSVAMGSANIAESKNSIAGGSSTKAKGINAVSLGQGTEAQGENSIALGNKNIASGKNSIASGDNTIASGNNSFVGGYKSEATNEYSFAHGILAKANGVNSFALGMRVYANNSRSYAMGIDNTVDGEVSLAFGRHLKSTTKGQVIVGQCNELDSNEQSDPNAIFIVANGTTPWYSDNEVETRRDAFKVYKNGDAKIANALILSDAKTGENYRIYVSQGKLQLEVAE